MKTSAVSKIAASIPIGKKSKFNLSHDVNTTYDWGSVQPLFSKLMLPDSSINVNLEQLTRLAPMNVPTFGRVKMKNVAHFIPMKEIFPNWEYFLAQEQVSRPDFNAQNDAAPYTFIPTTLPHMNNSVLSAMVLAGSKANLYFSGKFGQPDENVWYCARNTGTFANPAGWAAATTATRQYGNAILNLTNSANPSTYTMSDLGYEGYVWNVRKVTTDGLGGFGLSAAADAITYQPTITTMIERSMPNSYHTGFTHGFSNEENTQEDTGDTHVTMEGADLIWEYAGSDPTAGISSADRASSSGQPVAGVSSNEFDGCKIRIVFKLSSFGKRLRKILIGLGYDVNLGNYEEVCILPLFAFYKAYWDSFAPERNRNFYTTSCWKLIMSTMSGNGTCDLLSAASSATANSLRTNIRQFFFDLGTCFATDRMDVVSAATENIYGSEGNSVQGMWSAVAEVLSGGTNLGQDGSAMTELVPATTNWPGNPAAANQATLSVVNTPTSTNPAKITQPQLDALKKAYIYINKYSVAGKQIEEILRSHGLGSYVDECKGRFIDASENNIKISDVVATAGTEENPLGDYGGRGIGFQDTQFSFSTDKHGYMIVLSTIVPEAGYTNSPAHENTVISFRDMYNPEFDGLSMEMLQKKSLSGSPVISDPTVLDSFGYVPTYTQWKFMSNKANGDFSLNSMKKSMLPYTLDKYLPVSDVSIYRTAEPAAHPGSEANYCPPRFRFRDLPNASEDYRFINKYPWNGNFNRIFNAQDDGYEWSAFISNNNTSFLYNSFEYDNFITHNVFQVSYYAHMKPIEDSYSTYDEEHGAPSTSISKA